MSQSKKKKAIWAKCGSNNNIQYIKVRKWMSFQPKLTITEVHWLYLVFLWLNNYNNESNKIVLFDLIEDYLGTGLQATYF